MALNFHTFITQDVWKISESDLITRQAIALKSLKIFLLALYGFKKNTCELRAMALTMYTVLSIVPIIAMLFGVAKGFGFEKVLQKQLVEQIPAQDKMMLRLIDFAEKMLANAEGGVVAGMGIVLLFWTVIKVIGTIEDSFNQIWQIKQGRSLTRKLSDYLSLMLLAPILLIVSSSMTVFVKTQVTWLVTQLHINDTSSSILLYTLNYMPIAIMAILFSFIFMFMPNQKVNWSAGVIAGMITGIIYQLAQWAYLTLQVLLTSYNAIYGSFAALPLFFIWLQLGWVIVLFGCEISYYIQYYANYKHNEHYSNTSFSTQKIIALQVCQLIIQRFARAETALSCEQIALRLNLPHALVETLLIGLVDSHLLIAVKAQNEDESLFQPAQDIGLINVAMIIRALENKGNNELKSRAELAQFVEINKALDFNLTQDSHNYLLKALKESGE